jgi:hypothetical protein
MFRTTLFLLLTAATAHADVLAPQVQVDGGLSVIGVGYEHPVARRHSVAVEAFVFGTYFLPWFNTGEDVKGVGLGVRPTWFARDDGHGLYVTPFVRAAAVDDESLLGAEGLAVEAGVFVGWAFALTPKLDLRIGGGGQYIYSHVDMPDRRPHNTSTPFIALDAVLGMRL